MATNTVTIPAADLVASLDALGPIRNAYILRAVREGWTPSTPHAQAPDAWQVEKEDGAWGDADWLVGHIAQTGQPAALVVDCESRRQAIVLPNGDCLTAEHLAA